MKKQLKKVYLSPDVLDMLEAERRRTNYSRNIIIEMLVREHLGGPQVEEAVAATPAPRRREPKIPPTLETKAEVKRRVDLGI